MIDQARVDSEVRRTPSLGRIIDFFARYGNFTLGGGSATSAVMHRELVTKRHWLSDDSFALCFALGRLTPGTNLLANCTALGWLLRRLPGAICALLAASIPCTLMVVVLTSLFSEWQQNRIAQAAIHGAVAAAVAITAKTSWTIARPHYKAGARLRVVIIGAVAFGAYVGLGVSAIYILLLAGVVGAFLPEGRS
ncbi:chromate transporter [Acidisphaera sp. S103]|uniref:chromate transporter n=1 Tax=Acidisphaera sp. S103 TaxID=1747223 RepID=UPI00131E2DF4|nr:chromate transporter [Acidisphaera sp. S103]